MLVTIKKCSFHLGMTQIEKWGWRVQLIKGKMKCWEMVQASLGDSWAVLMLESCFAHTNYICISYNKKNPYIYVIFNLAFIAVIMTLVQNIFWVLMTTWG